MSKERSVALFVQDMLDSIEKIDSYRAGVTADDFATDSLLQDAVFRRLEVIGEAAKHVSEAVRARHPNVPWQEIAGLRDVLIHKYFGIIVEQVWQVITTDLPAVEPGLQQVKADLEVEQQK